MFKLVFQVVRLQRPVILPGLLYGMRTVNYIRTDQHYTLMEPFDRNIREKCFKSRKEIQIARFLERNDIAFQYEYPLAVVDRGKARIYYPDFRLPEYGMIIEYFGVNGNPTYNSQTRRKMAVYRQFGIDGIFLTEASFRGDWPGRILGQMEDILKGRLDKFYTRQIDRK